MSPGRAPASCRRPPVRPPPTAGAAPAGPGPLDQRVHVVESAPGEGLHPAQPAAHGVAVAGEAGGGAPGGAAGREPGRQGLQQQAALGQRQGEDGPERPGGEPRREVGRGDQQGGGQPVVELHDPARCRAAGCAGPCRPAGGPARPRRRRARRATRPPGPAARRTARCRRLGGPSPSSSTSACSRPARVRQPGAEPRVGEHGARPLAVDPLEHEHGERSCSPQAERRQGVGGTVRSLPRPSSRASSRASRPAARRGPRGGPPSPGSRRRRRGERVDDLPHRARRPTSTSSAPVPARRARRGRPRSCGSRGGRRAGPTRAARPARPGAPRWRAGCRAGRPRRVRRRGPRAPGAGCRGSDCQRSCARRAARTAVGRVLVEDRRDQAVGERVEVAHQRAAQPTTSSGVAWARERPLEGGAGHTASSPGARGPHKRRRVSRRGVAARRRRPARREVLAPERRQQHPPAATQEQPQGRGRGTSTPSTSSQATRRRPSPLQTARRASSATTPARSTQTAAATGSSSSQTSRATTWRAGPRRTARADREQGDLLRPEPHALPAAMLARTPGRLRREPERAAPRACHARPRLRESGPRCTRERAPPVSRGAPVSTRKPRSHDVTEGDRRAPARAMLRAVGLTDADVDKPQIGIASSWNEITPCNLSLARLAKAAKEGVQRRGRLRHAVRHHLGVRRHLDGPRGDARLAGLPRGDRRLRRDRRVRRAPRRHRDARRLRQVAARHAHGRGAARPRERLRLRGVDAPGQAQGPRRRGHRPHDHRRLRGRRGLRARPDHP